MVRMKKGTNVRVTWHDTVSVASWLSEEQRLAINPATRQTTGTVVSHDDVCIRISPTINDDDGDLTVIPTGCVRKIERLLR